MQIDWKGVSRKVLEGVLKDGYGLAVLGPPARGIVINLSPRTHTATRGEGLHRVRRWLWEHRKMRALRRGNGCVWAVREGDMVLMGVGAIVDVEVAVRFERMFPQAATTLSAATLEKEPCLAR